MKKGTVFFILRVDLEHIQCGGEPNGGSGQNMKHTGHTPPDRISSWINRGSHVDPPRY